MEKKLLQIIKSPTPHWFNGKFFSVDNAYELLKREGYKAGGKPAAYRALNSLVRKGLIGRFEKPSRYFLYS